MMTNSPPNIILLVGEDTGTHHGCYGCHYARTPHLDRLAATGCRFDNALSTAPVCAPARSSLVTGTHPFSLGTHHMRSTLMNPPRLFTRELRDTGYFVSWPGKRDFNFEAPPDFADSTDDWLDDLREERLPESPFLLYRNFGVTHESTMWTDVIEGERGGFSERLAQAPVVLPGKEHDASMAPVPPYLPDHPAVRADIARYFDALAIQDHQIGEVLQALDGSRYADNTLVVYLSDHGRGLVREKRWCYDAGLHIPLIARWPGVITPGSVSKELVSTVDIPSTLLSLAGTGVPSHYQGQVFLGSGKAQARECLFAGRDRMDEAFDRVRVCRDRRYHYIRNDYPGLPYAQRISYMERQATTKIVRELHSRGKLAGPTALWLAEEKPPEELYDTWSDPAMVNNLARNPGHQEVLTRLRGELGNFLSPGDLGAVSERELIQRGLVADRLEEYRARIKPLPAGQRIGPGRGVLEMEEAREP